MRINSRYHLNDKESQQAIVVVKKLLADGKTELSSIMPMENCAIIHLTSRFSGESVKPLDLDPDTRVQLLELLKSISSDIITLDDSGFIGYKDIKDKPFDYYLSDIINIISSN